MGGERTPETCICVLISLILNNNLWMHKVKLYLVRQGTIREY